MYGYELAAHALIARSSAPVFGVLGNANMLIFAEFAELGDQRLVSARHEAGAVAMADGYARASGQVGVSTVTCGPGLTQVATSLLAAARGRSPQVLLVGDTVSRDSSKLQVVDQAAFAAVCESGFVRVTQPDEIPAATREAFWRAAAEQRPVLLSIPQDVQQADSSYESHAESALPAPAHPSPTPPAAAAEIDALAQRLMSAQRPIIVVGRGSRGAGQLEVVRAVAAHVGALLATSLPAKGAFLGDPWDLGVSGAFACKPAEELMAAADVVLGVGAGMGYYTTEGGLLFADADIYRIDRVADPDGPLTGQRIIVGESAASLRALLDAVRRLGSARTGYRTPATAALLDAPGPETDVPPADGVDPRALMSALAPLIDPQALVVVGGGHFWAFPIMYLAGTASNDWLFSYQFGAIGQTLPVAIGAWYADPARPLVVFDGDGSLLMNVQELDTAVRYGIPMVVIIGNDSGFGSEVHKLRAAGLADGIASFPSPDLAAVARGFGGQGYLVRQLGELAAAEDAIRKPSGLTVVDVRVSPSTPSDPYLRLHYGQDNQAPRLAPQD